MATKLKKINLQKNYLPKNINQELLSQKRVKEVLIVKRNKKL